MIGIIIGLILFIAGFTFLNFLTPEITTARLSTNLNCANADAISSGNKMACLFVDLAVPLFVLAVLSFAGSVVAMRWLR